MTRAIRTAPAIAALMAGGCGTPLEPSDLAGRWGGEHVEITFDTTGAATIQYDCAHGRIVAPIALAPDGALTATGDHVRETGGPVQEGEVLEARPARYDGEVRGDRFTWTVTLADSGTVVGTFTVQRDEPAMLVRCL